MGQSDGVPASDTGRTSPDEPVAVFRTTDGALLSVVKSVLDAAGIPYFVQGERSLGLFPLGPFGSGIFHRHGLAAIIHVPRRHLREAKAVLAGFNDEAAP